MSDEPSAISPALTPAGPLDHATAVALIERADALAAAGDYAAAAVLYSRVVGHQDVNLHVSALMGLGECHYRLDNEPAAVQAWIMATQAPDTPLTWVAWRQIAATRVRSDDIPGAIDAYRRADRLAPPEARAEIASRLGWLSKEQGDRGAAGRYFGRSRTVATAGPQATYAVIAVTVVISLVAMSGLPIGDQLTSLFLLDKQAVAAGEYWRLLTVTLLHAGVLHLAFNMYALFLVGPLVERMYGPARFVLIYVLCAAGGSVASFIVFPEPAVGASGAIFGLFGIVFVALWRHQPLLDRGSRALASQIGFLIVFNLVLNLGLVGTGTAAIDIAAHIGGLATGAWLGLLLVPSGVGTLAGRWQRPGAQGPGVVTDPGAGRLISVFGVAILLAVLAAGIAIGTPLRSAAAVPAPLAVTAPIAVHEPESAAAGCCRPT